MLLVKGLGLGSALSVVTLSGTVSATGGYAIGRTLFRGDLQTSIMPLST